MKIGELATKSGVSARQLRYYEQQGLIAPVRDANGYRSYDDSAVRVAMLIRELVDAGLTTQIVRELLPCVISQDSAVVRQLSEEMLERLRTHQSKIASRMRCLSKTHEAIEGYIDAVCGRGKVLPA